MITTIYTGLTDNQLYELFGSASWKGTLFQQGLTAEQKQQALQELSNRAARDYKSEAVPVRTEDIRGYGIGSYSPGEKRITLNQNLVEQGKLRDEDGNLFETSGMPGGKGSSWRCVATTYHESWHAAQHQSEENPAIYGDAEHQKNVAANLRQYISPSYGGTRQDYDLYRIQLVEKEANEYGYAKAVNALQSVGSEKDRKAILASLKAQIPDTYDRSLQEAQLKYGSDILEAMQSAINDRDSGAGVQANRSQGYYATHGILTEQELVQARADLAAAPAEQRSGLQAKVTALEQELKGVDTAAAAARQYRTQQMRNALQMPGRFAAAPEHGIGPSAAQRQGSALGQQGSAPAGQHSGQAVQQSSQATQQSSQLADQHSSGASGLSAGQFSGNASGYASGHSSGSASGQSSGGSSGGASGEEHGGLGL